MGSIKHEEHLGTVIRLLDDFYDGEIHLEQSELSSLQGMKAQLRRGTGLNEVQREILEELG